MGDKDLSSIENDIARTRQQLASTIDQLVYRASPRTIARREANQLKAFFVDENGPRTDNIVKVVAGVGGFVALVLVLRRVSR
ncbi:MAG TPA: DUF3618 domain-containing protein [Actinomycetales bacterium]|nr:DUF3618 domain-containing protein [Actinomycetales bacterium]